MSLTDIYKHFSKPWGLTVLMLSPALSSHADIINSDQARAIAVQFKTQHLYNPTPEKKSQTSYNTTAEPELVYQGKTASDKPAFYVFNYGNNSGFSIVAADNAAIPVLGFSENGNFNPEEMPENMKEWLTTYSQEIASLAGNTVADKDQSPLQGKSPIAPLIKTKWNQSYPYNLKCPVISGYQAPSGCTATAMAQIMNYHQWPQDYGAGEWSFSRNGYTASCDFSQTKFDWENMTDTYDKNSSEAQNEAVAELMYACGVATDMFYGASTSGAYMQYVPDALKYYFGYDGMARYITRTFYSFDEWENIIYNELAEGRPVQYEGYSSTGGHSFVIDGYAGNNYFHFNWGWGGMSDGYFVLTSLNPQEQGIGSYEGGYNSSQAAVIGICPPAQTEVPAFVSLTAAATLTLLENSLSFTGSLLHNSMFEHQIEFGVKIIDENGKADPRIVPSEDAPRTMSGYQRGRDALYYGSGQSVRNLSFSYPENTFKGLEPGTYRLYPIYKTSSMPWTEVPVRDGNYISFRIDEEGNLSEIPSEYSHADIEAIEISSYNHHVWDDGSSATPITLWLSNKNKTDFNDKLTISFNKIGSEEEKKPTTGSVNAIIPGARTTPIIYTGSLPAESGEYKLSIFQGDTKLPGEFTINVTAHEKGDLYVSSVELPENMYEKMSFSSQKLYITYANRSSENQTMKPSIRIFSYSDTNTAIKTTAGSQRTMSSGETKRLSYSSWNLGSGSDYIPAGEYFLQIYNSLDETPISLPIPVNICKEDDVQKDLFVGVNKDGLAYVTTQATSAQLSGRPSSAAYSGVIDIPEFATINGVEYPISFMTGSALSNSTHEAIVVRPSYFKASSLAASFSGMLTDNRNVYLLPENFGSMNEDFTYYGIDSFILAPEISFTILSGDLDEVSESAPVTGYISAGEIVSNWDTQMNVSSTNPNVEISIGTIDENGKLPVVITTASSADKADISITPRQPYASPITLSVNGGTTGIEEVSASDITINVTNTEITISGIPDGESVAIYTPAGTTLMNRIAKSSSPIVFDTQSHGIFIVRVGRVIRKVAI